MSSVNANYEYGALTSPRSFRLLELKPGTWIDSLEGELRAYLLPTHALPAPAFRGFNFHRLHGILELHAPAFQALSYVWGLHKPAHNIRCNGKSLPISESLHRALCLVRGPRQKCFVWADAVCINQSAMKERKHQAKLPS